MSQLVTLEDRSLLPVSGEALPEVMWLMNFPRENTRKSYMQALRSFMAFVGVERVEGLRSVTDAHVLAWRESMVREGRLSDRTITARMSALSSMFKELADKRIVPVNPVSGIKRPRVKQDRVETAALSREKVREMLCHPDTSQLSGLRDEAILMTFFYTGCRLSELRKLRVKDLMEDQGYAALDFQLKGGKRNRVAIHPVLVKRLRAFLEAVPYGLRAEEPIFQALRGPSAGKSQPMNENTIANVFAKYARMAGFAPKAVSPHSARATFITQALEHGCPIEDVQQSVGHSHISTTQGYDKRGMKPERSASFRVSY